jgi:hypothetical protein
MPSHLWSPKHGLKSSAAQLERRLLTVAADAVDAVMVDSDGVDVAKALSA